MPSYYYISMERLETPGEKTVSMEENPSDMLNFDSFLLYNVIILPNLSFITELYYLYFHNKEVPWLRLRMYDIYSQLNKERSFI